MKSHRILYIGAFKLPDKNAAAHRVMANAKAIRDLGHEVIFINRDCDVFEETRTNCEGFVCYDEPKKSMVNYLFKYCSVKEVIEKEHITAVIAYNYPAVALNRLRRYLKRKGILCFADVTEWYVSTRGKVFKYIKNLDTAYRMKRVHFKLDGIIAISDYLYKYYKDRVNTVKIPPLVDIKDKKWIERQEKSGDTLRLCYAGSPAQIKERLDLIVDAVGKLPQKVNVTLTVIGITKDEYLRIYCKEETPDNIKFLGRISNSEVIRYTTNSDWTIIIRDNNLVVKAGFPTKVSESISCGTPVIANRFSNIDEYLDNTNSILIDDVQDIKKAIELALTLKLSCDNTLFDYRRYLKDFKVLLKDDK